MIRRVCLRLPKWWLVDKLQEMARAQRVMHVVLPKVNIGND